MVTEPLTKNEVNINLDTDHRTTLVAHLNRLLADEVVLQIKTKNYHWNVEGPQFHSLHALFETQYDQLKDVIDEIAERARQLGGYSAGSLKEFLALTRLPESVGGQLDSKQMVANLVADHEAIIRILRELIPVAGDDLGDVGTEDELTGYLKIHEKMAWMLRAHIS